MYLFFFFQPVYCKWLFVGVHGPAGSSPHCEVVVSGGLGRVTLSFTSSQATRPFEAILAGPIIDLATLSELHSAHNDVGFSFSLCLCLSLSLALLASCQSCVQLMLSAQSGCALHRHATMAYTSRYSAVYVVTIGEAHTSSDTRTVRCPQKAGLGQMGFAMPSALA